MTVTSCIDVFNELLYYLVKQLKNNSHETSDVPFRFVFFWFWFFMSCGLDPLSNGYNVCHTLLIYEVLTAKWRLEEVL